MDFLFTSIEMKIIFCISCIIININLFSQQLEIEYSVKVRKELSEEEKTEILKGDPEYGKDQIKMNENPDPATYKMMVSDKESSFTYIEKISNNQDPNMPIIRFAPAGFGTVYHNFVDSITIQNIDIHDIKYHSRDPLKKWNWKISRETKTVLGYEVRKATTENDTDIIEVWYAPKIVNPNGPANYWGLPGFILEVYQKSKEHPYEVKYKAESIKHFKKKLKVIKPIQGKQISISEVDKIYEEANSRRNEIYKNSEGIDKD